MKIRHKYGAVRVERNGFKFDSKKECRRYDELLLLQKAGEVLWFTLQPPFYMPGRVKYVADFQVFWADGTVTFEDVKGFLTDTYKMKKRMMAVHYPHVEIQEI